MSRALNLNEDLTEAIALGHDLGHTPFGHVGEEVLDEIYDQGFRHNEQSLRVVDILENNGRGLNLTHEVRDGILNHSKSTNGMLDNWGKIETIEGEIVRIADAVAYINHDLDDAVRAGVISTQELPATTIKLLGNSRSERINKMVSDIIVSSWSVRLPGRLAYPSIKMSAEITAATEELRQFLFDRVYNAKEVRRKAPQARAILIRLYRYFELYPEKLPVALQKGRTDITRQLVDHIAGMTDRYASNQAGKILQRKASG